MEMAQLSESLPPEQRLALAYAPARSRAVSLGLFALDARLAGVVRNASEPLLGQIRLAWWRDRLGENSQNWPEGEPLLALLRPWGEHTTGLRSLVDGWEALMGEPPAFEALAEGRARSCAALAMVLGEADFASEAERAGRSWALADMAGRLSSPEELAVVASMLNVQDLRRAALPRTLRPLAILHGLARRAASHPERGLIDGPLALLSAVRLGILGR